jgi:hypothetical protein
MNHLETGENSKSSGLLSSAISNDCDDMSRRHAGQSDVDRRAPEIKDMNECPDAMKTAHS